MAKQNNSLTELQALEGIYEHLSTIDDLAKEVGAISTRLRKIEERLKEPVDITDPILAQDLTRDTCIYGALAKSMEACRGMKVQKESIRRLSEDILLILNRLMILKNMQADLTNNSAGIHRLCKEQALIRIIIVVSCLITIVFVILVN